MHSTMLPERASEDLTEGLTTDLYVVAEVRYPELMPLSREWNVSCDDILALIRQEDVVPGQIFLRS